MYAGSVKPDSAQKFFGMIANIDDNVGQADGEAEGVGHGAQHAA